VSPEFPPELSTRAKVAIATVALLTFLYSIVVAAQILLWFVVVGFAVGLYLTYLLIVAVFRLVAAVERIATAAEVDSGIRTTADARGAASAATSDGDGAAVSPAPGGPDVGGSDPDAGTTDPTDARSDEPADGGDPGDSDGGDPGDSDDPDPPDDRTDGG
jgi:hypothetical protein